MNAFKIEFNTYLDEKAGPREDGPLDCGLDSVIVVHDGDALSACQKFRDQKMSEELDPFTDEETGKEVHNVISRIDITACMHLHADVLLV